MECKLLEKTFPFCVLAAASLKWARRSALDDVGLLGDWPGAREEPGGGETGRTCFRAGISGRELGRRSPLASSACRALGRCFWAPACSAWSAGRLLVHADPARLQRQHRETVQRVEENFS